MRAASSPHPGLGGPPGNEPGRGISCSCRRRHGAPAGGPALVVSDLVELGLQHEQQHQELLMTDIVHTFSLNPLYPAMLPGRASHVARGVRRASSIVATPLGHNRPSYRNFSTPTSAGSSPACASHWTYELTLLSVRRRQTTGQRRSSGILRREEPWDQCRRNETTNARRNRRSPNRNT